MIKWNYEDIEMLARTFKCVFDLEPEIEFEERTITLSNDENYKVLFYRAADSVKALFRTEIELGWKKRKQIEEQVEETRLAIEELSIDKAFLNDEFVWVLRDKGYPDEGILVYKNLDTFFKDDLFRIKGFSVEKEADEDSDALLLYDEFGDLRYLLERVRVYG